jgi:hypothetical protein
MLFARNALASGPQAWLGAEKGLFKVKVARPKKVITIGRMEGACLIHSLCWERFVLSII